MKIKRLRPEARTLPRCDGIRETKYENDTRNTDKRCHHRASFQFGSKYYCRKHAGVYALRFLMKLFRENDQKDLRWQTLHLSTGSFKILWYVEDGINKCVMKELKNEESVVGSFSADGVFTDGLR